MKKTLTILLLAAGVVCNNAKAQVRFAPEAGINLSKVNYTADAGLFGPGVTFSTSTSMAIGLKVGVVADLGLSDHFSIQPGIFYSMKNGKTTYDVNAGIINVSAEQTTKLNYIDIPVMALYKFDVGPGKLFAGIGPNVGIGIGGKREFSVLGIDSSADVKFGSDSDQVKRIDFGGNVNVGYELPMGLYLRLSYNMGFVNLSNIPAETYKNMGFGVSVGYMFGNKAKKAGKTKEPADKQ